MILKLTLKIQLTHNQLSIKQHFSDVYPPTPTNVFPPKNSPNNTIYPPKYDYSMPPSHVYPPGNDFIYSFPSRYTHQPSIRCSLTSNYVFPPPSNPYLHCSPSRNPYPPPYNAYPPQYSHLSPSSGPSNSGTNDVTHNTSTILSSDYCLEDPPVLTLVQLTPRIKKCYGCGNNTRSDGSNAAKPPYDVVVRYKE